MWLEGAWLRGLGVWLRRSVMRNAGLEEVQAGIKIAGRNINNLRYADDTTLTQVAQW